MNTLAERIQWVLDNVRRSDGKHWGVKSLAMVAGLGQSHISSILHGKVKNPQMNTIEAIARTAGVSVPWLMSGDGEPMRILDSSLDQSELEPYAALWETDPILGNSPLWPALLAGAKQKRPNHPQWVWDATAESRPQLPGLDPSVSIVVLVSDIALELVAPPPPGTRDGRAYYRQIMRDMTTTAFRNLAAHAEQNKTS